MGSSKVTLRSARGADQAAIRTIIWQVGINPIRLDWRRFLVAVDEADGLVGCGQIKPHRDGSHELASIAVVSRWRGQGVARAIIERLIAEHETRWGREPLFLTCRSRLGPLYERFGFRRVDEGEMTTYFRRIHHLSQWVGRTGIIPADLWVMKRG